MTAIVLSAIALIGAIIILIYILYAIKRKPPKSKKKLIIIALIVAIIGISTPSYMLPPIISGMSKGMNHVEWQQLSLAQIKDINASTPNADTLPNNRKGCIVILYKYGCPDCEAIYDELTKYIAINKASVYFIPSGSPEGKKLVETGKITNVPTAIYIRNEALANGATINSAQLYSLDAHDKPYFNNAALQRLLLLQEKQK